MSSTVTVVAAGEEMVMAVVEDPYTPAPFGVPLDARLDAVVQGCGYLCVDARSAPPSGTGLVVADEAGRVGSWHLADDAPGAEARYRIEWATPEPAAADSSGLDTGPTVP